MFSDPRCDTLLSDIPPLGVQPFDEDPLAPLNFDDLLDIAREFEFTRTITHIWPCEESTTCTDAGLDDILAAILPTQTVEECPLLLPSSGLPMSLDPVHQEVGVQRSVSTGPAADENASTPGPLGLLPKDNDPTIAFLQGWSPPNGSQFLDLDDNLMLPRPAKDMWISPWLSFLAPSNTHPVGNIHEAAQTTGHTPQTTEPRTLSTSIINMAVDNPGQITVPFVPLPTPGAHPGQCRPGATNASVPGQSNLDVHTKMTKYRVPSSSAPATGLIAKYAKPPRGGIPPHIARTVTKANILRMEKERKVMQDAFSALNTGEGKKPSVLRRATGSNNACGEGGEKNLRGDSERRRRAAKRMNV